MSAVPLQPSPTPIFPGGVQGAVLLVNNGLRQMTVSNSSAPLSGDVLYPGASMLWPAKTPLYAMGFLGDYLQVGAGVTDYTNANAVANQLANTTLTTTGGTPPVLPTVGAFSEIANYSAYAQSVNYFNVETDGVDFIIAGGNDTGNAIQLLRTNRMTPAGVLSVAQSLGQASAYNASAWVQNRMTIWTGFKGSTVSQETQYSAGGTGDPYTSTSVWPASRRRFGPGGCALNGQGYVACGSTTTQVSGATQTFVALSTGINAPSDLASTIAARIYPTLVAFQSGKLWLLGGQDASGVNLASTEIYDVANNVWTNGPALPEVMGQGSAAAIGNYLYVYCAPTGAFYRGDGTTWTKLTVTLPWNAGDGLRLRALGTNLYAFGGLNTNKIGKATVS